MLLNPLVPSFRVPPLELKVSRVRRRPNLLPLSSNIHEAPNHRNEIQRPINQRPEQRRHRQLRQRCRCQRSQPGHRIRARRPNQPFLLDQLRVPARNQRAVKGIRERVAEEERPREEVDNRRALAEDEQGRGYRGQRPTGECQKRGLRDVCEEEHCRCHCDSEGHCGAEFGEEGCSEWSVRHEVEDSLEVKRHY